MPNSNVIEIILEAIDNASSVITGVSKTVQDSSKQVSNSLKEAASSSDVVEQAFGKLKGAAANLGISLGAASIFREFISASGESEMAAVRLELAYKNLGIRTGQTMKSLNEFAMSVQRSTTFTDEAVAAMQERLFRFGTLTGDVFIRVQKATIDYAAAMQMDLGSAAQMLGRALEDPARGMLILRRSGLILSDNQKQLIKDFMKAGETAKAQGVILDELEKRYKGTAETVANTLTGSIEQLKISWGDLFEGTQAGIDSFKTLAQEMAKALQDEKVRAGFNALFGLLAELTRLVAGATYGWVALAGVIADVFTAPENGGELRALWDQQSAAAHDYNEELKNLAATRAKLNLSAKQTPTAQQLDQRVTITTSVGGQRETTLREQLKYTTELLVKTKQLQQQVNEAAKRDPAERARQAAADAERTAQSAADKARAAAEAAAAAEAKKAEARRAAVAAAKEEAKLVDQINQDANSTLAAIEAYTGAGREYAPVIDLQMPDVADPSKLIDLPGIQDTVTEAQQILDTLTAPTLEEVQLQIQTDAGWIDPVTDGIREAVMAAEDLVRTPIEQVQDKFANLESAIRQMILALPEGSAEIERLNDLLVKLAKKQAEEIKGVGNETTEFAKQAARNAQDAFANFLFDPFKGGVRGMLKAFADAIRQMIAQVIAARIFKALGFASLFGAAGGGIIPGGRPTLVGENGPELMVPTSKMGALGGSAGGGMIPSNAPRLVGENGPEVIYPTVQSSIINARQMAFAGGRSANVNYSPSSTIVINGSADKEAQKQMAAMIQYNNEQQMKQITTMLYNNGLGRMR